MTDRYPRTATSSALPPVIVMDGQANSVSIARSLGRAGITVYALNREPARVRYSRFCTFLSVPDSGDIGAGWLEYLLGSESDWLEGAVLLAAGDTGLELIARNRSRLAGRYRLDESNPRAQLLLLDKLETYRIAASAGVPTPRFWSITERTQAAGLRDQLVFPLLVKPTLSHRFQERFGKKFFVANSFADLEPALETVHEAGLEVLLVELIPGPDDRLCSYYSYLDEDGTPQFHFTKRVLRRFPVGMGIGTYHVTDANPEVQGLALKLFRAASLRGLANAEFKYDERDGQLKLIECNARFTAANCLVHRSGLDLPLYVYNRRVGRPLPRLDRYRTGMRLWYPVDDFRAFMQLRREGTMSTLEWVRGLMHPQTLPYFDVGDPMPALMGEAARILRNLKPRRNKVEPPPRLPRPILNDV